MGSGRSRDAEGFAASVEHDMRSGSYIDPTAGRVPVGEWARSWLAAQGHLTPSTFTAPNGGVLRARNFRRNTFDPAVRLVGPAGFHPHELRHTAASLAIASGADVKVVQQMLGHKTATLTLDLYGHLFPDRLDDLADRIDAAVCAPDVLHEGQEDERCSP